MKKKLKTTKFTSTKELMLIDNTPLRHKSIYDAQHWLNKIEELEKISYKFHTVDMKLYTDWYNLMFKPVIEEIDELRRDYQQLAEFHNILVQISLDYNLSLVHAFIFWKEEEEKFTNGDQKTRKDIEKNRLKRKHRIEEQINEEIGFDSDVDSDREIDDSKEWLEDEDFLQELQTEEEDIRKAREKYASKIKYYENLSTEKLNKNFKHFEEGLFFLLEALDILLKSSRLDILKKIWQSTPQKLKKHIDQKSKLDFGMTFDDFLCDFEERENLRKSFLNKDQQNSPFEDLDETEDQQEGPEDYFNYNFFAGMSSHKSSRQMELTEDDKIKLKSLYRNIVRKIHPDNFCLDVSTELKNWLQGIWTKVVQSYKEENLQNLTALYFKTMIALKEYDDLSIYELNEASKNLKKEYDSLSNEYSHLKDNPAWNFSETKDLKKLKTKLSKPFSKQKKLIQKEIDYLRTQHHELEELSEIFDKNKIKKASPKKRKKARVKKVKQINPDQINLFDQD